MTDYIPFVYTEKDCDIFKKLYSDSVAVRVSLETIGKIASHLPSNTTRWVDPSIDGLQRGNDISGHYRKHIEKFKGYEQIGDSSFQEKPKSEVVRGFVASVLDECVKVRARWISVPQLPQTNNSSRNRINRELAKRTQEWKSSRSYEGKLILPVIFTHQNQINLKTQRNQRISLVKDCYKLSGADGVWIVESSLSDQDGSHTFDRTRFPGLLNFHQELQDELPLDATTIGGPYWGMNVILWVRGSVKYPAIGLGNCYQYYLPGGILMAGKVRIALPPLRRWAVASSQLEAWLKQALKRLPKGDVAYDQFSEILRSFSQLSINSRMQVATFYREWLDKISAVPTQGRALALYQDLSSAYVVGKKLPELPKDEGTARKPWQVAKQLMVNCL